MPLIPAVNALELPGRLDDPGLIVGWSLERGNYGRRPVGFSYGVRAKDGQELALTAYESPPQPRNKDTLQLVAQQWARVGAADFLTPAEKRLILGLPRLAEEE